MIAKISDFSDIQGGLVLSRKEAKGSDEKYYSYKRLTVRSLEEKNIIATSSLEDFHSTEALDNALFTEENDIVIRLSFPMNPVLIDCHTCGLLVPSQLAVIRVKNTTKVLPDYLRVYLTQKNTQDIISNQENGSAQKSIKVRTISQLELPIPDLSTQEKIIQIENLSRKRELLYLSLIEQEHTLTDILIEKIIGGTN